MQTRTIVVTVAWSPAARVVFERTVVLPQGATVQEAITAAIDAADASDWTSLDPGSMHVGVWGRAVERNRHLTTGDRIDLCRPLAVDPKVARRERFKQQGARGAGLFSKRRTGGKAGY
ncbi:MAG: RnfH family protein [Comamonadaceae bacterium]|nr:MAG: RnfH family protein [Comamonadaceae bacterium]